MCGVAGFAGYRMNSVSHCLQILNNMADSLDHRGPDAKGVDWDSESLVGLAHARLSIQDVSPMGHQPMLSSKQRFRIIFNGEIYNFNELRLILEKQGCRFKGGSDTEVLLHGFETWGVMDTLEKITGMYAIVLVDRLQRKLYLIRDRIGEKPLYYRVSCNGLSFASELKPLSLIDDWDGELDNHAVQAMLRYNNVPAPLSIYKNVYKLLPGTCLEWNLDSHVEPTLHTYWSVKKAFVDGYSNTIDLSDGELLVSMQELLNTIIDRQMIADVPLGAFLSGGIDSSLVTATMQSLSQQPIKTFTIGFDTPGFNEAEHALAVARHLRTDHHELYVKSKDALDLVPKLGNIYDEPFGDSSQIPTYLVSKMAKKRVTVVLSGDGGDEFFGGYSRYISVLNRFNSHPGISSYLKSYLPANLLACVPSINLSYELIKSKQESMKYKPASLWDAYHEWTFPSSPSNALVLSANGDYKQVVTHLQDSPRSMMLDDSLGYLPNDILVKADRAAMANSLECRMPFLDHQWIEFSCRIPWKTMVADGQGKSPLKKLLFTHIPKSLVERPKQGFAIPLGSWLRNELRDWGESILFDAHGYDYINKDLARQLWTSFQKGRDDYNSEIWNLLMFSQWVRNNHI